jgi:hypothetical protein
MGKSLQIKDSVVKRLDKIKKDEDVSYGGAITIALKKAGMWKLKEE